MKSKKFNDVSVFFPESYLEVKGHYDSLSMVHKSGTKYHSEEKVFGGFAVDLTCKKSRQSARRAMLFTLQLIEEAEEGE